MTVLVIDIGSSSIRASEVSLVDFRPRFIAQVPTKQLSPAPGIVEIDTVGLKRAILEVAEAAIADAGSRLESIAIASQRASAILWDKASNKCWPIGISWQDLRTASTCLMWRSQGLELAPNETATKYVELLRTSEGQIAQPALGTIDSFAVSVLTKGEVHISDITNAATTGLISYDGGGYDLQRIDKLGIDHSFLPKLVEPKGTMGVATALSRPLPITALIGDQQASMIGQACVTPGSAKLTLGTGAMLDLYVGEKRPGFERKGEFGCFPIAIDRNDSVLTWGIEAIGLSAGSCIEWMASSFGLSKSVEASEAMSLRANPNDQSIFVPSLAGQGPPKWDFGARGAFFGMGRGTRANELFQAAFRGIAHMSMDLLESAEADGNLEIQRLMVDGKMTTNSEMVKHLAAATGLPILLSKSVEATTLGAGLLGLIGMGELAGLDEVASLDLPATAIEVPEPRGSQKQLQSRQAWRAARDETMGEIPALSMVSF